MGFVRMQIFTVKHNNQTSATAHQNKSMICLLSFLQEKLSVVFVRLQIFMLFRKLTKPEIYTRGKRDLSVIELGTACRCDPLKSNCFSPILLSFTKPESVVFLDALYDVVSK